MGAPTSEVGYTSATTRRENHEVFMYMCWYCGKISYLAYYVLCFQVVIFHGLLLMFLMRFCVHETRPSIEPCLNLITLYAEI
jgi:hypothetical protein